MVKQRRGGPAVLSGAGLTCLAVALLLFHAPAAQAQGGNRRATREALVRAEDARGDAAPLVAALRDPALRAQALRGLGRLERPDLLQHLVPFLDDPALGATAAEAIAQSTQGLPAPSVRNASAQRLLDSASRVLTDALGASRNPAVTGALARSLARLPFDDPRQARAAERAVLGAAPVKALDGDNIAATEGIAHGLYTLARGRRALGDLTPDAISWLRSMIQAGGADRAAPVRRLAWLAVNAMRAADGPLVAVGIRDPDPQVRRQAVLAVGGLPADPLRHDILDLAAQDPDQMVRLDWVGMQRLVRPSECDPLVAATRDASPHVVLAAIDALNGPCASPEAVVTTLRSFIAEGPVGPSRRPPNGVSWHARAHALVTLARIDPRGAEPLLWTDSRHPVWQVRMYVARGAALIRDTAVLSRLAFDSVGSVREVALTGLSTAIGHLGDAIYVRALSSPDHHVVVAAARALKGAPVRDSVLPAILDALDRLHREARQTSRDPRMELLNRVEEMMSPAESPRIRAWTDDVDPAVAARAAALVRALNPQETVTPSSPALPDTAPLLTGAVRVRVTMSQETGGGAFEMQLDADNAPVTVARIVALIRRGYYDGLTFHRVVPNFVLQGGSPAMNEYVGTDDFLRDELGLAHHERGTLGVSTRGRDTGDAQWFINLVDNYRLDHDYTVFARITSGMDVVDRILEGDVMAAVRVIP